MAARRWGGLFLKYRAPLRCGEAEHAASESRYWPRPARWRTTLPSRLSRGRSVFGKIIYDNGSTRDVMVRMSLATMIWLACMSAEAASEAEQTGVLRAAGVVHVATKSELQGSSYEKDLAAHGVNVTTIADGTLVFARLLCCRDNPKRTGLVALYNPLAIKVAPGDFIEIRVGNTKPEPGTPDGFITITRVLQRADQPDGKCWWEPRMEGLWLRYVYCEWMPAEGWVWHTKKLDPTWYKPAVVVENK